MQLVSNLVCIDITLPFKSWFAQWFDQLDGFAFESDSSNTTVRIMNKLIQNVNFIMKIMTRLCLKIFVIITCIKI